MSFIHPFFKNSIFLYLKASVADPDPSDPYVFGPPGSGYLNQRYCMDPDLSIIKQKIVRKTLIPTVVTSF